MAELAGIAAGPRDGAGGTLAAIDRGSLPRKVAAGAFLQVAVQVVRSFGEMYCIEGADPRGEEINRFRNSYPCLRRRLTRDQRCRAGRPILSGAMKRNLLACIVSSLVVVLRALLPHLPPFLADPADSAHPADRV